VPAELTRHGAGAGQSGNIFRTGADDLRRIAAELEQEGIPIPIDKERPTRAGDLRGRDPAVQGRAALRRPCPEPLGLDWTVQSCAFEGANFGMLSGYEDVQADARPTGSWAPPGLGRRQDRDHPRVRPRLPAARWYGAECPRARSCRSRCCTCRSSSAARSDRSPQAEAHRGQAHRHLPRPLQGRPHRRRLRRTPRGAARPWVSSTANAGPRRHELLLRRRRRQLPAQSRPPLRQKTFELKRARPRPSVPRPWSPPAPAAA
jgi:hypothetical protein